jgi:lysophospholipase L1-like esterase
MGRGVARLGRDADRKLVLTQMRDLSPDIVIVHVGENDIQRGNVGLIAPLLIEFIEQIKTAASYVIVTELLIFPVNRINHKENIEHINGLVKEACKHFPNVKFWLHRRGFKGRLAHVLFDEQNVHLNMRGLHKYSLSIYHAIRKIDDSHFQ